MNVTRAAWMSGVLLVAALGAAACTTPCASDETREGNACVRTCNSSVDCARELTCVDGRCRPAGTTGGSSGGGVNSSTAQGSSSRVASSGAGTSSPAASSAAGSGSSASAPSAISSAGSSHGSSSAASSGADLSSGVSVPASAGASSAQGASSATPASSGTGLASSSAGSASSGVPVMRDLEVGRVLHGLEELGPMEVERAIMTLPPDILSSNALLVFSISTQDDRPSCAAVLGETEPSANVAGGMLTGLRFSRYGIAAGVPVTCLPLAVRWTLVEFVRGAQVGRATQDWGTANTRSMNFSMNRAPDHTFILFSLRQGGTMLGEDDLVTVEQTDATLTLRAMSPPGNARVSVQVLTSPHIRVIHGNTRLESANTGSLVAVAAELDRTSLLLSHRLDGAPPGNRGTVAQVSVHGVMRPSLGAQELAVTRAGAGVALEVRYSAVEWPPYVRVLPAGVTMGAGQAQVDVPVPGLAPERAFQLCGVLQRAGAGASTNPSHPGEVSMAMELAPGRLGATRGSSTGAASLPACVVQF